MSVNQCNLDFPVLKSQSALISMTYEQLTAAANALWNLYAIVDDIPLPEADFGAAKERAIADMKVVQGVHDAFINCRLSLEAMAKTEGKI